MEVVKIFKQALLSVLVISVVVFGSIITQSELDNARRQGLQIKQVLSAAKLLGPVSKTFLQVLSANFAISFMREKCLLEKLGYLFSCGVKLDTDFRYAAFACAGYFMACTCLHGLLNAFEKNNFSDELITEQLVDNELFLNKNFDRLKSDFGRSDLSEINKKAIEKSLKIGLLNLYKLIHAADNKKAGVGFLAQCSKVLNLVEQLNKMESSLVTLD